MSNQKTIILQNPLSDCQVTWQMVITYINDELDYIILNAGPTPLATGGLYGGCGEAPLPYKSYVPTLARN